MIICLKINVLSHLVKPGSRIKNSLLVLCVAIFLALSPHAIAATATPSFSTGTGTYHAPPTVTIGDVTSGAIIYYTTDGTTPTTASNVYTGPVTIAVTSTLQAIAVSPSGTLSAVNSATYTVVPALAPSFSTGAGTYYAPPTVTISDGTSGAVIYYTTNGTKPTTASTVYTGPITIGSTTVLEALAIYPGGSPSTVTSATYTVAPTPTPSFGTGSGTYYAPPTITISDAKSSSVIYYTTNGSTPTTASTVYTGPITIGSTTTLEAIAVYPGGSPSALITATYTISAPMTPSFSTGTGTYYAPPTVKISEATSGSVIYYTTNGSTPTTASTVYTGPITIGSTTTLEAIAVYPGGSPSTLITAIYTVSAPMTPSFSTGTGTYYAPPTVKISEATSGSVIYYTTNGSTPTTASTVYTGPITIGTTTTLEAVAVYPGGSPSALISATYTISAPLTPSFSTGTGTYYAPLTVKISEATSGAVVYYTTNGSTPTTASTVYTGPITIGSTTTLEAVAVYPGGSPSTLISATYTISAPMTPSFSTGTGTYYAPPTVKISEATSGAVIYYTTNGTTPTTASTVYTGPITIGSTTTLEAVAVYPGGSPSALISATYTISAPLTPSFSTGTGTYYAPPTVKISEATSGAVIYYTTNGTTPTTASTVYTGPITIGSTTILEAVAVYPGGSPSALISATYTISAPLTPSFSTGTGTYYAPPTVKISEATSGAVVYYTTSGSTPTTSSSVYTAPITIGSTTTLQAIAVYPGGSPSAVISATYTVIPTPTPSFSTGTGTYYAPPTVTISDAKSSSVIYYTTNGSTPTPSSSVYTAPITIGSTTTLEAIAVYPGGSASAVISATYTIAPPLTPSFSTGAGTYYAPPTVKISDGTSGAVIYYTTNGSMPTTASAVYTGPLTIGATTTLEAIAVYPGGAPSAVASAVYTVAPAATPVLSIASGLYEKSVTVSIIDGTPGAVIYYTTNGAAPTTASAVYTGPITFSNTATFSSKTTLQAIAVYPGGWAGPAASATYTILAAQTPINSANSTPSFLGMNASGLLGSTPWPLVPVGTFRLMGLETNWSTLNPALGTYQWITLDREVSLAQANGAQLLYTFVGTPPWAIPTGSQISSISRSGGVVTVTTTEPHGLYYNPTYISSVQGSVTLSGPANSAGDQSSITVSGVTDSSFDGTFVLTGTPTPTSLTYAQAGTDSNSTLGSLSAVCGGTGAPSGCAEAPASLNDWDQFVTELVNHVGPGVVRYWELWNEANIGDSWRGDPNILVQMASDAKTIIKNVDPNAIILSPSTTINFETPAECATYDPRCGSTWLNNWLAAGGKNSIDAVAFHGYPAIGETPEQIQGAVTLQQLAMNQNGVGSLPLWDTESSWGLNTALTNQNDQVAFLGRHLLLEHSMGVQGSFWYSYDNSIWGSLWSPAAGLNPVGEADQQVAKWIEGSTLTQPCAATAADPTTFTCGYTRPNGYTALAVWNTVGAKTFTAPQGLVQYHDLYGDVVPVTLGSVGISTSPILLETFSAF